jgi:molybdate/tungstate transport system permease protein
MKITRLIFGLLSLLIILFVVLPLAVPIFSTTPNELQVTLRDPEVIHSLGITFLAGILATFVGLLTGVPLAYLLARHEFHGKRLLEGVLSLPVIIPHTAAGISLLMVFGREGMLGRLLAPLGVYFMDTLAGVVVAMLFVSLPFLINGSKEAFRMTDVEMEQVAQIDGANYWQVFFLVILPQAWRGITGAALMMWARGISEFGAVAIIAYHPKILPVLVYERFVGFGLNLAQPITAILIFTALIAFIAFSLFVGKAEKL